MTSVLVEGDDYEDEYDDTCGDAECSVCNDYDWFRGDDSE